MCVSWMMGARGARASCRLEGISRHFAMPDRANPSPRPAGRMAAPVGDSDQLVGGELNAAVTSALVGIHGRYLGRGPKTASTFHYGNVLVTLMNEVLTSAEKSVALNGQLDAVSHMRHLFQQTMEDDFREAVERLTGRKVLAFISGNHVEPDVAAELFILDGPPGKPDGDPLIAGRSRSAAA